MKSLTLSDAHIWKGGPADNFHVSDSALIAFFERMLLIYDFIVLAGDWFELLKGVLYSDEENWHSIAAAHPVLVAYLRQRIEDEKIIYVNGNHDTYIRSGKVFPKARKKYIWVSPDAKVRILWEHGHHGDFICKKLGWLSRVSVWVGSLLEATGIIDADTLWNWLTRQNGDPGKPDFMNFYEYIVSRAREFNAQIIICGHTHITYLGDAVGTELRAYSGAGDSSFICHPLDNGEVIVANAGCCVNVPADGKFPAVHAEWNEGDTMPKVELKYMEV